MQLKLDYDRMTIYTIVRIHKMLRSVVHDLGWWVDGIAVYHSSSHRGRHVELQLHARIGIDERYATVLFEQVFRSDGRRGLWQLSRLESDMPEWVGDEHWDILWSEKNGHGRTDDPNGTKRLKKVWIRGRVRQ